MPTNSATKIGEVRQIMGLTVTASLDSDIAGAAPLYEGRLREVSQIGTFVRIPRGLLDLVAVVSKVGVSGFTDDEREYEWQPGEWKLQLQLLGHIERGSGKFQRGVGTYPEINDPVHFITPETLRSVFPEPNESKIKLGYLSTNLDVPVTFDLQEIVVKHSAIVGSTGSGKTSTVASILQNLNDQGWNNSNIILIDSHSEYSNALEDFASVLSVLPSNDEKQLEVPCWALSPDDILHIFLEQQTPNQKFRNRFEEFVVNHRRNVVEEADWLDGIDATSVNPDSPIPFDIRSVWHKLDYENQETVDANDDSCELNSGDPENLIPAKFEDYGPGGTPPHQGDYYGEYGNSPHHLRRSLEDPRLRFFQRPRGNMSDEDPLETVIQEWLGNDKPVSVLDFSGVPKSAAQAAVGIVLNFIFEISIRSDDSLQGIGRNDPVLIIIDEAHRYVGTDASRDSKNAVNRIAKEGRKYGVGLMLVTQRPSEIPTTTLSQCGTLISLRLSNGTDQGTVNSALPDTTLGVADALPSLRRLEGVISGEAVELPARVFIDEPDPFPRGDDPSLEPWSASAETPSLNEVLRHWRETYN